MGIIRALKLATDWVNIKSTTSFCLFVLVQENVNIQLLAEDL